MCQDPLNINNPITVQRALDKFPSDSKICLFWSVYFHPNQCFKQELSLCNKGKSLCPSLLCGCTIPISSPPLTWWSHQFWKASLPKAPGAIPSSTEAIPCLSILNSKHLPFTPTLLGRVSHLFCFFCCTFPICWLLLNWIADARFAFVTRLLQTLTFLTTENDFVSALSGCSLWRLHSAAQYGCLWFWKKIKTGTWSVLGMRAVMRRQKRTTSLTHFGYKLSRAQSQHYYSLFQF